MRKKKKAFTLLELLVVIAIISIFSTTILIRFNILKEIQLKSDLSTLLSDVDYCKRKAMDTGYEVEISFKGNSYEGIHKYKDDILIVKRELKVLTVNEAGDNENTFNFLPIGTISKGDSVTFYGLDRKFKLIINPVGGNARIEEEK